MHGGRARWPAGGDDLSRRLRSTREPELIAAVGAAASLALENERLNVELRARVEELRASRTRIVQAADDERRRLERDLHDGAQQRLVSLALNLRLASSKLDSDPAAAKELLEETAGELGEATTELRELARGLHPAVLSDRGLAPGARGARRRARRCRSSSQSRRPSGLPAAVESASYFVVAEALTNVARYAQASQAEVERQPQRTARSRSRSATTASAAPTRARARACAGSPTASRRSTGASRSSARRGGGHDGPRGDPVRVVVADDSVLLREGVVRLLEEAGIEVVGQAGDADELLRKVRAHKPDVAIVDVRMPPTNTDDGLRAAQQIRGELPEVAVLVLSQYVEEGYALELLEGGAEGVGYLLKDRVAEVERFIEAVRRVADGGSALDPRGRLAAARPPAPRRGPARRAHPARARGARADGRGAHQPGDRGASWWSPSARSKST